MSTPEDTAGRYENRGELGRGGMGQVLRVGDRNLGRDVAMKVVHGAVDPDRLQRFVNEARITGQLEHPNIVPVHELGTDAEGRRYFTMKLIEGESLGAILERLGGGTSGHDDVAPESAARYPLSLLLQAFLKVCDAVGFAHSRGVIHRDLKPDNVMVGEFGEVLVVDWGLAKARGAAESRGPDVPGAPDGGGGDLTLEGDLMGTPAYMAPEQARAEHAAVDSRTDIFALGAMLYAILSLRAPYEEASTIAAVRAAQECRFVPPSERAPNRAIPPELESICRKAMQKDPVDRYASAAELEADVLAFLEHRLVQAHHYGATARVLRGLARHPAASLATTTGLVVLAVTGAIIGIVRSQKEASDARAAASAAQAEVARVQADAAQQSAQRSAERAEEAEVSLQRMRSVARLMRRARADLGGIALELKQIAHAELPDDTKITRAQELMDRARAFGETVPPDAASQATWHALRGWLWYSARNRPRAADAFEQAKRTDPDVVSGRLFEAMALLSEYMAMDAFPSYRIRSTRIEWNHVPRETVPQEQLRKRLEALLEEVRATRTWGETSAEDCYRAFNALQDWYHGRIEAAVDGFGSAMSVPEMDWIRDELLFMRARARIRAEDFRGAIVDLQRVVALDTLGGGPWQYLAQANQMRGFIAKFDGRDPIPYWRRSIGFYEETLRRFPRFPFLNQPLALVRLHCAEWMAEHDEDPRPLLDQAIEDLGRAVQEGEARKNGYNTAVAFLTRHDALMRRAQLREQAGGAVSAGVSEDLRRALADLVGGLVSWPTLTDTRDRLPAALQRYTHSLSLLGHPPATAIDEWLAKFAAAQQADPTDIRPVAAQAEVLDHLHRPVEAAAMRRRQLELLGKPSTLLQQLLEAAEADAKTPAWRRAYARGTLWSKWGDFARARTEFRAALDACTGDDAPAARDHGMLHYLWARMAAQAAAGRTTFQDPAGPPPDAAAWRAKAVAALQRAKELGYHDVGRYRTDSALAPLRNLPEFQALLK